MHSESRHSSRAVSDLADVRRSRDAVDQRHAVKQHARRKRAEQEVLHRRFVRLLLALRESNQHVERQRHQLETDVKRDQIVAAGDEHHADGGEENECVVFAVLFAFDIEKASRDADRERGGDQKDCFEEKCEAVDAHHAVESRRTAASSHEPPLHRKRNKSERDTDEREVRRELALAIRQNHFHHQRHTRASSQDQLGRDQLQIRDVNE